MTLTAVFPSSAHSEDSLITFGPMLLHGPLDSVYTANALGEVFPRAGNRFPPRSPSSVQHYRFYVPSRSPPFLFLSSSLVGFIQSLHGRRAFRSSFWFQIFFN